MRSSGREGGTVGGKECGEGLRLRGEKLKKRLMKLVGSVRRLYKVTIIYLI
jgi:hypothetical protein